MWLPTLVATSLTSLNGFLTMSISCYTITQLHLEKGSLGIRRSVDFWYFRISLKAWCPGRNFLTGFAANCNMDHWYTPHCPKRQDKKNVYNNKSDLSWCFSCHRKFLAALQIQKIKQLSFRACFVHQAQYLSQVP